MEFVFSLLGKWVSPGIYLNPNMKNLKKKVDYLSTRVDDIETELRVAEFHPAKRPRKEAQHWHRIAREILESISRLEEKVDRVGRWRVVSRILLGKEVVEKTQEVVELQQHIFPRGPLIDTSPSFEQFMAAARFFRGSETITTGNKRKYSMDDELSNVNHQLWQPCTSVNNQYLLPPPLNTCKVITTAMEIQHPKVYSHQSTKKTNLSFIDEFPTSLRPYIQRVKNVDSDGNCGFRAIAGLMGFGEDGWLQVRKDLLQELHTHIDHYRSLFCGQEKVDELITTLAYFESNPGYDHWMIMPDMGYLISSFYNVVLFQLSSQDCFCCTFLPLRTIPIPIASRKEICIGFVNNNHFVQVFLVHGHPVPPIATDWRRYRSCDAVGWETAYSARMNDFTSPIGSSVVTTEAMESNVDI